MSRVLKDDAELGRAIEAMQKFCSEIDELVANPLSEPEEVKTLTWRLNATAELVQKYSRGRIVQSDPSRASYYEVMGWDYQVFT
ncbi:MAG: hypothetical protein ABS894_00895 [Aerococcus urinaeequi]